VLAFSPRDSTYAMESKAMMIDREMPVRIF
jgi:hypothetical protein